MLLVCSVQPSAIHTTSIKKMSLATIHSQAGVDQSLEHRLKRIGSSGWRLNLKVIAWGVYVHQRALKRKIQRFSQEQA